MQISEELFIALLKYHLVEIDDVLPEIKKGLEGGIYIQNIRLHQPRKREKRQGRSIWKRWECTGTLDGKTFPLMCMTGAWHAPVYGS